MTESLTERSSADTDLGRNSKINTHKPDIMSWALSRLMSVLLRHSSTVKPIQGVENNYGAFCFIDKETVVGNYNYFGNYVVITKARVGNYCSVGDHVVIGPGNHDYRRISTSSLFVEGEPYEEFTVQPVEVGSDVWIGAQAIILRGVKVGHGAVVAANSVVTKDVPPYAIVAGVPARTIKYRFDNERVVELLNSNWFNYSITKAKEIIRELETQED